MGWLRAVVYIILLADVIPLKKLPEARRVRRVAILPSEETPPGSGNASTAGYLEIGDRTELTEAEIGQYIVTALRDGFVVTIYPATKRGVFVNANCVSASAIR